MPRNTEGEFELVLGNKQLLSLFFLVVVLFAVFFSLGYMVGKSVAPSPTLAAQPAPPAESAPPAREPAPSPISPPPSSEPAPAAVVETQPAARVEDKEGPPPAPAPSPALISRELHLQVAAVRVREDAEALAESIRKKGYDVFLNSETRDGWYRILLGPFPSERAAQDMKARLEKDGYKSILKKP